MAYKYLPKFRPPVPPTKLEAVTYLRPGKSWWSDVGGSPIFVKPDGTVDEEVIPPTDEELEEVLSLMLEEWEEEEKRIELRQWLDGITEKEWWLWKDIHDEIIPGKEGKFYQNIKSTIDKYSEGKETILYPYPED
jgi:hypothetical protein